MKKNRKFAENVNKAESVPKGWTKYGIKNQDNTASVKIWNENRKNTFWPIFPFWTR